MSHRIRFRAVKLVGSVDDGTYTLYRAAGGWQFEFRAISGEPDYSKLKYQSQIFPNMEDAKDGAEDHARGR